MTDTSTEAAYRLVVLMHTRGYYNVVNVLRALADERDRAVLAEDHWRREFQHHHKCDSSRWELIDELRRVRAELDAARGASPSDVGRGQNGETAS